MPNFSYYIPDEFEATMPNVAKYELDKVVKDLRDLGYSVVYKEWFDNPLQVNNFHSYFIYALFIGPKDANGKAKTVASEQSS